MLERQGTVVSNVPRGMASATRESGFLLENERLFVPAAFRRRQGLPCGELLLLGHDRTLLNTRMFILQQVGFRCQSVTDIVLLYLDHSAFRLVILCHTLTRAEACRVVQQVYLGSPGTTILRLAKEAHLDEEAYFRNVLVAPTPDRLITTVQYLCHAPQSFS